MTNIIKSWFIDTKNLLRKGTSPMYLFEILEMAIEEISNEQESDRDFLENFDLSSIIKDKNKRIELRKNRLKGETLAQKIASKVSIIDIADQFGLEPYGKNKRICPFHADKDPSLSLNEDRGLFHCFGCGESGNIIKFVWKLKKINPDFELKI